MSHGRPVEFPQSSFFLAYVVRNEIDGEEWWSLMDSEGIEVCASNARSGPYFFAAEHEITVVMRH